MTHIEFIGIISVCVFFACYFLPTPVFWPGEFHGLCSPWSHKESDTTEKQITSHNNIDETAALTHRAQSLG